MWAKNRIIKTENLILLCQWLRDISEGEMIERKHYTRSYLAFPGGITQRELDALCNLANAHLCDYWNGYLIRDSMGDIVPCKLPLKEKG